MYNTLLWLKSRKKVVLKKSAERLKNIPKKGKETEKMRKTYAIMILAALIFFFRTSPLWAGEEKNGWNFSAEANVGMHSGYIDESSGAVLYGDPVSNQSLMIGVEKQGTGFYLKAENFIPFEKESKETDFYGGLYTEAGGMKFDLGYAHYWMREKNEASYHAIYGSADFPEVGWQIIPFVKAEYRFATKQGVDEHGSCFPLDGFVYQGGFKREFKITKKVSLNTEVAIGGNTGIYGLPAENLSFAREKIGAVFSFSERWKVKVSALTQQNLGKKDGIAAETEKLFVSAVIVWAF
jgi:hypothetical protein